MPKQREALERLRRRTERMLYFLKLETPPKVLIIREAELISRAVVAYCGLEMVTKFRDQRVKDELLCEGFNGPCDNPVIFPTEFCDDCSHALDKLFQDMVANETDDSFQDFSFTS